VRNQAQLSSLKKFYIARSGALYGFRFKDFSDFTTASDGVSAATRNDEVLPAGTGVSQTVQLVKRYTSGGITSIRPIVKPKTVLLAFNGVLQTSGYSVDLTTGKLTHSAGSGVAVTWGGEFDVPVRFDESTDQWLSTRLDSFDNGSTDVVLIEVRDTDPVYDDFWYGGSCEFSITASVTLKLGDGRVQIIQTNATGLYARLPSPTGLDPGGPYMYIVNNGPNSLDIQYPDSSVMVTLATNETIQIVLTLDGSSVLNWIGV
jgi:uncharacterized protein (TIGR02217 family)